MEQGREGEVVRGRYRAGGGVRREHGSDGNGNAAGDVSNQGEEHRLQLPLSLSTPKLNVNIQTQPESTQLNSLLAWVCLPVCCYAAVAQRVRILGRRRRGTTAEDRLRVIDLQVCWCVAVGVLLGPAVLPQWVHLRHHSCSSSSGAFLLCL